MMLMRKMSFLVIIVVAIFTSICSTTFTYSAERRYRRQDIAKLLIDGVDNTKQGQDEINPSAEFINKQNKNVNENNGFKGLDKNKSPDDFIKGFNFGEGFPFGNKIPFGGFSFGQGWPFGQGGKQNLNTGSESTINGNNLDSKELSTSTSSDGSGNSAKGFPFSGNNFSKKSFSFGSGWPFNQGSGQT
ncbi:uncharacterized protein LOC142320298 [Lycorma delicatula]|uniref:uncharacterized protein LOC142320298 n=1 Tax=Lycorma delicatula TaxID=130591 RepID=UPI003F50F78F